MAIDTVMNSAKATPSRWISLDCALGVVSFLLALLFYGAAVLRTDFSKTASLDLGPYTDAVEYFAQATSLLQDGKPSIQIGYDKLPSRYPPGFPVLMLPWLKCLPQTPVLAPFRTNQTIGLLLLLGCFGFYLGIGKPLAGGIATLLLATQPALVTFSKSSMSDLSGAAAAVLAFALVYLGLNSRKRWPIYGAAIVLGLSLCIRVQLVFFAPLLISMALFPGPKWRLNWLLHCIFVLVVFALATTPYFLLNQAQFGDPLKSGYAFWVPRLHDRALFSAHSLTRQASMLWLETTATWSRFRVANLFGTGTHFVPAFALLCLIGLARCRCSPFTISALLAGTVFLAATGMYLFFDARLYIPLQLLLVAVAAHSVIWTLKSHCGWRGLIARVPIIALFILSCAGYPSQSGFPPKKNRSQTWDALTFESATNHSSRYEATVGFARAWGSRPGIVFSNIDPVYLNALLPQGFVAAPVNEVHSYCYSRQWHYGRTDAARLAARGISQNDPVYALLVDAKKHADDVGPLPEVEAYFWQPAPSTTVGANVMILTPASSDLTIAPAGVN